MSQINYEPHRNGQTVLPDVVDEVTGQTVEGTSQVVDTRVANFAHENYEEVEDSIYEQEQAIQEDPDHPDYVDDAVELANISEEIHEAEVSYNEEMAQAVVQAPMSDSPSDVTVQYLSHKVFNGDLTPQEAFEEAMNSGINPEQLAASYNKIKSFFNN